MLGVPGGNNTPPQSIADLGCLKYPAEVPTLLATHKPIDQTATNPQPIDEPIPPSISRRGSPPMVPQQSRLLGLPRELRDHIYREYIFSGAEEGYIYDFPAGKLRTATGRPIDLNLMYTCRRIAAEMQGLALGLQTITFSTLYSEDVRVRAGFWETIIEEGRYNKYDLDKLAPMMAEDMTEEVARRYRGTHFYDAFCRRRTEDVARFGWGREGALGDVPSVFRRMTNDVMQLAVTDPAIYEAKAEEGYYKYRKRCDPSVRAR